MAMLDCFRTRIKAGDGWKPLQHDNDNWRLMEDWMTRRSNAASCGITKACANGHGLPFPFVPQTVPGLRPVRFGPRRCRLRYPLAPH
jgi:hypothetical protein